MSTLNNNNNNSQNDFNKLHSMMLDLSEQVSFLHEQMDWIMDHFDDDVQDQSPEEEDGDEPNVMTQVDSLSDDDSILPYVDDEDDGDETDVMSQVDSSSDDDSILPYVDDEFIDYE